MRTETTVEQTASAPAPVENAAPAPADEVKAPELGSTDTPADTAAPVESEVEKRNKTTARQRINELTRDKHQLRNENTDLRKKLEEYERQNQPQEPVKPKLEDFGSDAEFDSALNQYYQNKHAFDSRKNSQQQAQEQETQRKQADQFKSHQKFVSDLNREKGNFEGMDEVIADPIFAEITRSMSPDIISLVQGSEKNVALFYHLGTHIEEAERIASLPPVQAARELALLESRLEIPKPKTVSTAPEPVKPVKASSVTEKDPKDMSDKEFAEWRRKQIKARGGRA